jgi:hypothetical protein
MNERIRELAEQATEYANEQNELHGVGYVITFKEKFAELIVKECAVIAKHHVMNISTYSDAKFVEEQIKQHFGVEE